MKDEEMKMLHGFWQRIRGLWLSRNVKEEIDEELRFHIDQRTAENIEKGMGPEAAAREAGKSFGNVQRVREECRERRGSDFGAIAWQDIRFGLRMLRKAPGFTAVALLTLALGIGVNTSMFSALLALMSRALPYSEPDNLVQVFMSSQGSGRGPHHSVPNFLDYQQSGPFQYAAALNSREFSLVEPGQPAERAEGMQVSAALFPLLGIQPELGRFFTPEEEQPGRNQVVILEHGFWERRFAADPKIIGRVLRIDGEPVTVVGVMPARFKDPMLLGQTYVWRPFAFTEEQRQERGHHFLKCIARLKPGLSLKQAQAATDVLVKRLQQDHPDNAPEGLRLVRLANSSLPQQAQIIVLSIMALAGFVLLIACANLANLQFARTAARSREFAIRAALGVPRRRLLQQVLTESLVLAVLGGALGLVFAYWSNVLLSRQFEVEGETMLNLSVNWRVLAFALLAATVSGLTFGLLPAWLASRTDANAALKAGSRGCTGDRSQHRIQHGLIVAEVALALMLLSAAGLVVNGLRGFAALDPGWQVAKVTLGYLTLPEAKYGDAKALRLFIERLEEKLEALPGVEQAALCWNLPVRQFNVTSSFGIDGRPEPPRGKAQACSVNGVTPGYFTALGMQLLAGRYFTSADGPDHPPVMIINQTMARAYWPGSSPLGQRVNGAEIVGMVNDVQFPANPEEVRTSYQTYRPLAQEPRGFLNIALRGPVSAASLRQAVAEVDVDQPVGRPGTALADVESSLDDWAVGGKVLSIFALLGVALAALGIYGVISGFVVRSVGEIGVRMALGAEVKDVLWLVIRRGLKLSVVGAALGMVGAFGLGRLLASVLPGLAAHNEVILVCVPLFLIGMSLLACWIPACRAARVDPAMALRSE